MPPTSRSTDGWLAASTQANDLLTQTAEGTMTMTHMDASSESRLQHTYFVETCHRSNRVHQNISGAGHSKKGARSMIAPQHHAHANVQHLQAETHPHPVVLTPIFRARIPEQSGSIQHHHNAIRFRVGHQ